MTLLCKSANVNQTMSVIDVNSVDLDTLENLKTQVSLIENFDEIGQQFLLQMDFASLVLATEILM